MLITPFYTSILASFFVFLSIKTIRQRRASQTAIGFGSSPALLRAARVHANFSEYVPLALILILVLELNGAHFFALHALGIMLFLGRCSHAYGVSQVQENFKWRITGMRLTFAVLILASAYNLFLVFQKS